MTDNDTDVNNSTGGGRRPRRPIAWLGILVTGLLLVGLMSPAASAERNKERSKEDTSSVQRERSLRPRARSLSAMTDPLEAFMTMDGYDDNDNSGDVSAGDVLMYTFKGVNVGTTTIAEVWVADLNIASPTVCTSVAVGSSCSGTSTYLVTQDDIGGVINNKAVAYAQPPVNIWVFSNDENTTVPQPGTTYLALKVLLEGAMQLSGTMRTTLAETWVPATNDFLLPSADPYNTDLNNPGPYRSSDIEDAVDWIRIELRPVNNPSFVAVETSAVVRNNGEVKAPDSSAWVQLPAAEGDFYLVIRHQSHLPAATFFQPVTNSIIDLDMTASATGPFSTGFHQTDLGGGLWALIAGNADQTTTVGDQYQINGADRMAWQALNGSFSQYVAADINLDGSVDGFDKAIWQRNNGIGTAIPQ